MSTMLRVASGRLGARIFPVNGQAMRSISNTTPLLYPRALRALEMKYVDGTCTLSVPLPLSGFDEERVFSIPPETTVASIIAQIEAEDATVQIVDLRSKRGRSFNPQDTLQQILKDDFELIINDRVLPVTAPVFTGNAYVSLLDDGELDVRSVAQKSAVIALRHSLETSTKWKITVADFIQMCREKGIPKKQAPELLKVFHQAGVVFYFGKADQDEDLQHSIFLQPRNVLDAYLETLGLTPVSTQLFTQEREKLLAKIQSLEPEHIALKNLEKELHNAATRHANGVAYVLSSTLVGGFGLYFWLSFIHFSWDIMEPVTYFTGFGMSIVGYTWWSATNQEYEYENIYDYFYKTKLLKLKKNAQFDQPRYEQVTARLADAKIQLHEIETVLKKSTTIQANYLHLLEQQDADATDATDDLKEEPSVDQSHSVKK